MSGSNRDQGYVMRDGQAIPVEEAYRPSPAERQALALEMIADTLGRMLAVMLDEGEPEAVDPGATLDDPSDPRDLPLPFDEDEHAVL